MLDKEFEDVDTIYFRIPNDIGYLMFRVLMEKVSLNIEYYYERGLAVPLVIINMEKDSSEAQWN